jgi:hypothetical protein
MIALAAAATRRAGRDGKSSGDNSFESLTVDYGTLLPLIQSRKKAADEERDSD